MVNGPSAVHVWLRAGWAIGGVKDRYLFGGAGGDQLTGRVLAGLPYNEAAFASLPPHYKLNDPAVPAVAWSTVFPLYSTLPDTFKRALPYLLSAICHHEEWLRATLPAHHPLFSTPLFTSGALASLRAHVFAGSHRCGPTGMTATGIPPHLAMTNELNAVVKQTEAMKTQLLSQYEALPNAVASVLLSKLSINGAIPVTLDDLKSVLAQAVSDMNTHMRDVLPESARASAPAAAAEPSGDDARYHAWSWGGHLHPVPEGWRLSSTDVMSTWRLWHFGNPAERIRPLRRLKKIDLADVAQSTQWSKTNGVMKAITEQLVGLALVESEAGIGRLTEDDATTAITRAITALMERLKPGATRRPGRWTEMSIPTLYQHVLSMRSEEKRVREQRVEAEEEKSEEAERPRQRVRLDL
jgi:hypothetical protein